ncbi:MAG: DUF1992 domain-containing protein [Anaerolineae bacterium]|nr:DUF1992 domain-containing protein [Anaerolineae bacterium]
MLNNAFDKIVEDKIQAAMRAGEFDNLKGQGKPLALDENPFEPLESRLANHMLRQNDCLYPWMQTALDIEAELTQTRSRFLQSRLSGHTPAEIQALQAEFFEAVKIINKKILDYNLQVPSSVFLKMTLHPETEWGKIRENK